MSRKREYQDDDGRTVADMSDLPSMSFTWTGRSPHREKRPAAPKTGQEAQFSRKERFYAVMGALGAGLLIGLVFIIGLGLVILLLLFVWNLGLGK